MCHSFYVFELHKTKTILHQFFPRILYKIALEFNISIALSFRSSFFIKTSRLLNKNSVIMNLFIFNTFVVCKLERSSKYFSFNFFSGKDSTVRLVAVESVGLCTRIVACLARWVVGWRLVIGVLSDVLVKYL